MALPILAAGATAIAGKVGTKLYDPRTIEMVKKAIAAGKGKYSPGTYQRINGMLRQITKNGKLVNLPLKKK